jgi:hypothetical protein
MASIGSTISVDNPGYTPWQSKVELDTDTGKQTAYVYGSKGQLLYTGTPQEVASQIPTNGYYSKDKAWFDKLISIVDGQSANLTAQYQQLVPPSNTEPVPTAAESTPNPNKLTGSADDDKSYDTKAAGQANANSSDNQTSDSIPEITITDERPKKPNSPANVSQKPGIRSFNPLGDFASYTYQLTLYMITPDAYDSFVLSGRKNINVLANESTGGAYIVAQSGGVNNTSSKRAPGFELDYYIDDLKIMQATSGSDTQTESNVTTMNFNIYEPYGFSFLSRLRVASEALQQNSKLPNIRQLQNETKQFFILGVRFQGYDIDGNVLPANNSSTLKPDSPTSGSTGVYERYFDIVITKIQFTLDGKMSTYKISASTLQPSAAYSTKRAKLSSQSTVVGRTVFDALKGTGDGVKSLISLLNKQQSDNKSKTVFKLEFIGPSSDIEKASLVTKGSDKSRAAPPPVTNVEESNEAASVRSTPNLQLSTITLGASISIMQAISEIIKQSSYMADAVTELKKAKLSQDEGGNEEEEQNKKPKRFRWYNLSSIVKCIGWNSLLADWDYEITYVIQPYATPALISPYVQLTDDYYGPHKRYEYWYTGKNSEIISYELVLNNNYYTVQDKPVVSKTAQGGGADISQAPNQPTSQSRTGTIGDGLETQNSVLVNLFDPSAYIKAKVNIMGDPDYLMQDSPGSINEVYRQFYGPDGFTINPNGGQVFFEIYFKEGRDYNNKDGLMTLNEQILLWNYSPEVAKHVKGVSHKLIKVESNFSKGKFSQELSATINPLPNAIADTKVSNRESAGNSSTTNTDVRTASQETGSSLTQNQNGISRNSTGLMQDDATGVDAAIAQQESAALLANARGSILTNNQTSPTGGSDAYDLPFVGTGTRAENNAGQQNNNGSIVSKNVADDDATINTINTKQAAINNQGGGREIPEDTRGNRGV